MNPKLQYHPKTVDRRSDVDRELIWDVKQILICFADFDTYLKIMSTINHWIYVSHHYIKKQYNYIHAEKILCTPNENKRGVPER